MNPHFSLRHALALLVLFFGLFSGWSAHGQIVVDLQMKRRLYVLNEPILATVLITNRTGREVLLGDTQEGGPWFSFQITGSEDRLVPPRDPNYQLQPLMMHPGETVKRTVNLNELYTMGDFGSFHVRASVYLASVGKYFGSKVNGIELTDGQLVWKETVGVPEGMDESGDAYRTFSLLTLEDDGGKMLYLRVQGQESGTIYGCYNLGRMVAGYKPDAKFDTGNNLAVLLLVAPKTYSLARIGVGGNFLSQTTYVTPKSQPYLRKLADGTLQIVGAVRQETVAQARPDNAPKLSDRPAGF